jgi:hypothetical protein
MVDSGEKGIVLVTMETLAYSAKSWKVNELSQDVWNIKP